MAEEIKIGENWVGKKARVHVANHYVIIKMITRID